MNQDIILTLCERVAALTTKLDSYIEHNKERDRERDLDNRVSTLEDKVTTATARLYGWAAGISGAVAVAVWVIEKVFLRG